MKLPSIPSGAAPGDPRRVEAIEAYCALMIYDQDYVRGRQAHVDMVAIGIAETNLNNLAIGENWRNGTPEDRVIGPYGPDGVYIHLHYSLGYGWIQHDTGWLRADEIVNGVEWSTEELRRSPLYSLDLLSRRPGFITHQGPGGTFLDMSAWNAYKKSRRYVAEVDEIYGTVIGG